eukprot:1555541-Rhodomonas_salina.1
MEQVARGSTVKPAQSRLLTDKIPRKPYERGQGRNGIRRHFGQMKLFLSEVEFLTLYAARDDIVVYAGAADGRHFPFLYYLFPCISEWFLYDPHKFHTGVYRLANKDSNIQINWHRPHRGDSTYGFFTDEDASALCNYAERKGKRILFVSDIRRDARNDKEIIIDMMMQQTWAELLQCKHCMLKFRPPYPSQDMPNHMSYLGGDVVLQVYAPINSTECRLICSDYRSRRNYDIQKHEEQMAFFNNVLRENTNDPYVAHEKSMTADAKAAVLIMACYQRSWHNNKQTSLQDILSVAKYIFP